MAAAGKEGEDGYIEADLYAFLADVHTNPEKQALLAPAFANYVISLTAKPATHYTAADAALAGALEWRLAHSRDQLVAKMEQNRDDYYANGSEDQPQTMATTLFGGNDVPWADFMSDAAGAVVEDQIAGKIGGTLVGVGTGSLAAGASVATIVGTASTIFPYAGGGLMTVGGTIGGTSSFAAAGATAVGGPAAVIAASVTVGVIRGVQVFENEDQRVAFDALVASQGQPIALSGLDTHIDPDSKDLTPTLNRAILLTAISGMITGG